MTDECLDAALSMGNTRVNSAGPSRPAQGLPMAVEDNPVAGDDAAVRALIEAAAALAAKRQPDLPKDFLIALFARAVPEDILRYQAHEVAALAEAAWSLFAVRQKGTPKIRFEAAADATGGGRLKDISVLEIINDDMPFLLDSVMAELAEHGVDVSLVIHPVLAVARDPDGRLSGFKGPQAAPGAPRESFIHIHTARIDDDAERTAIVAALALVLADIRVCVQDWRPMMARVGEIIAALKASPPPLPADEVAEAVQFLEWLAANNFTFLGVR